MLLEFMVDEVSENLVDFSESTIFFVPPHEIKEDISFYVWGVIFDKNLVNRIINSNYTEDVYVSGMAKLTFYGVKSGEIKIYLYNPKNHGEFLKDNQGNDVYIARSWDSNKKGGKIYRFLEGCVIDWPEGFASLRLVAENVKIEFDKDDLVNIKDYIHNNDLYVYKRGDNKKNKQ